MENKNITGKIESKSICFKGDIHKPSYFNDDPNDNLAYRLSLFISEDTKNDIESKCKEAIQAKSLKTTSTLTQLDGSSVEVPIWASPVLPAKGDSPEGSPYVVYLTSKYQPTAYDLTENPPRKIEDEFEFVGTYVKAVYSVYASSRSGKTTTSLKLNQVAFAGRQTSSSAGCAFESENDSNEMDSCAFKSE